MIETTAAAKYFDHVVEAIEHSRSAFEQYHALRAAEAMFTALDRRQVRRLTGAIERQLNQWITPADPSRWLLAQRLVRAAGATSGAPTSAAAQPPEGA